MSRTKTVLKRTGLGLLALVLLLGGGGGYYFKSYLPNTVAPQSFPQIDGEIQLAGLNAPVDVYRDQMGIPHIYATTQHDLFLSPRLRPRAGPLLADGFLAPSRLWAAVRDVWRGSARDGCVPAHSGLGAGGARGVKTLPWRTRPSCRLIRQGVNAYLNDHTGAALSLEYSSGAAHAGLSTRAVAAAPLPHLGQGHGLGLGQKPVDFWNFSPRFY